MADNETVYVYYEQRMDIPLGLLYCILGIVGVCINGVAVFTYWKIRNQLKMLPFLICSICLAHNDLIMLSCSILPYGILLLAGRPTPHIAICSIFGFVHNFCERFAWLIITSIMVFRCVSMVFPVKTRNISPRMFTYILTCIGSFIFLLSVLPFFPLSFIDKKYEYVPNLAECSYQIDANMTTTALVTVIDVMWWTPFITCTASCVIFSVFIVLYSAKFKSLASKKNDAIKKTILLTLFFIVCYLPKAALSTLYISANKGFLVTWDELEKFGFTPFLYIQLVCNYLIPASRAAFTPLMLKLQTYIHTCNRSKRSNKDSQNNYPPKVSLSHIKPKNNGNTHVKLLTDVKRNGDQEKLV